MAMSRPTESNVLRRLVRRMMALGKWVAEPDRLPDLPPDSTHRPPSPSPSKWLIGREQLPPVVVPATTRGSFIAWLVFPESLPEIRGDREPIAGSLLHWICTGEQLTTTDRSKPTKEASNHES